MPKQKENKTATPGSPMGAIKNFFRKFSEMVDDDCPLTEERRKRFIESVEEKRKDLTERMEEKVKEIIEKKEEKNYFHAALILLAADISKYLYKKNLEINNCGGALNYLTYTTSLERIVFTSDYFERTEERVIESYLITEMCVKESCAFLKIKAPTLEENINNYIEKVSEMAKTGKIPKINF